MALEPSHEWLAVRGFVLSVRLRREFRILYEEGERGLAGYRAESNSHLLTVKDLAMPILDQNLGNCPPDIEAILAKIAMALVRDVAVERVEHGWVRFRVDGLTDWCAISRIELAKGQIFGVNICDYQVLCSATVPHGDGLWIQKLDGSKRDEYRAGVWQY